MGGLDMKPQGLAGKYKYAPDNGTVIDAEISGAGLQNIWQEKGKRVSRMNR